jgi:peptide methionine sulfoxide reductase msrA/msrB
VCSNNTGHAECIKVHYNPSVISLSFLLALFFDAIDPTSMNQQGGDIGIQYRTGIYYSDTNDLPVIEESLDKLQKRFEQKITVECMPLANFYPAEDYHQKYLDKNPNGYCHIGQEKFIKASRSFVNPADYMKPDINLLNNELSENQFKVTQLSYTEPPFQNEFWNHYQEGIYVDITTGEPLFLSADKFESGCGWPSFSKPVDPGVIVEKDDLSLAGKRTEVRSRVGDAHLGHLFDDGPKQTGGRRYCINSASLRFIPKDKMDQEGYGYLLNLLHK